MQWFDLMLPPHVVVQQDLETRGVDFQKWYQAAQEDTELPRLLSQCYSRHNYGHRRFDEQLHRTGVRLRLNSHCEWLLQQHPELQITQDVV